MIIRTHADCEIQQAWWRGEHLKVCKTKRSMSGTQRSSHTVGLAQGGQWVVPPPPLESNNVMCTLHEAIIKWNAFPLWRYQRQAELRAGRRGRRGGCRSWGWGRRTCKSCLLPGSQASASIYSICICYNKRYVHRDPFPFSCTHTHTHTHTTAWRRTQMRSLLCECDCVCVCVWDRKRELLLLLLADAISWFIVIEIKEAKSAS